MRLMLQRLQSPKQAEGRNELDHRILRLLENGPIGTYELASLADVCPREALSSVTKLIAAGDVRLVVLQYPWGVEFSLQRVRRYVDGS